MVTKDEIFQALLDLPTGKSPGPDGFNVEFYRFYWEDLGDSLVSAIHYFFDNSHLPASWGRTFVTLVPKVANPSLVSDFRPISLCNVCYKIISKILTNRLKPVLPTLVGREQAGFLSDRGAFDNILAVQEVAHSLEFDRLGPPRMLIKLDIEKAYDSLSWSAILATLTKMNFPDKWVSWISACLCSSSFSILINGVPSPWFSSSRGVRQGDPISSYLFILVAQNFSSMMNFALRNNFIPGFDCNLRLNFNHLLFADDLILITKATRSVARNINLCLSIYSQLTGQYPNHTKSQIFFPSWFNQRVTNSICSILRLPQTSFPLRYLGILISPKKISVHSFKPLIDKIRCLCSRWKNFKLSAAAKSILINSSILSIPTYYLSVYPIPDSVLHEITKLVRDFFWFKGGNGKGIHAVAWCHITDFKSEGGLGFRNLALVKHSLMAKNVFTYLNADNVFWVEIARHKYGRINFWTDLIPPRCSWVFRSICKTASILKPNLWINTFNPIQTSFQFDPWLFDVPIAFKPTFLNVSADFSNPTMSELVVNGHWNFSLLESLFGENLSSIISNLSAIDCSGNNTWVWLPNPSKLKISAAVYHHLNLGINHNESWAGWTKIWRLHVAPRVKHFIWLLLHGRISTTDYLHSINMSPRTLCILCSLELESADHLFHGCYKAQQVWNLLNCILNINISFPDRISSGAWITDYNLSLHSISIIAVSIWLLWKARCAAIFSNIRPNYPLLVRKAIAHVQEFLQGNASLCGRRLLLNNFSHADGLFLFFAFSWNCANKVGHLGYFVSNSTHIINCAGHCCFTAESIFEAAIHALNTAIYNAINRQLNIRRILHCHQLISQLLYNNCEPVIWRFSHAISNINNLLRFVMNPPLVEIPRCWNSPAIALASSGANNHNLNLFLTGRDLPRWIMKTFIDAGFSF
ncbi:uncharacterized protein LOC120274488 [Dioscorea cayenensis subsp. rotundata]|uniref:Uncharacterized protein LOC120274488 n=1 Tax=Dioscorea cayennensis subsp. rotundata TaxID=55577 RepID=A0AB40CFB8_DIOCR|nr:uncharacterized protein LOC120274488 [Dioscorea cayenensis subsp. rotundata]